MTPEDIGSHLHYDEQVATETYVLRNYAHLLTDAERATLDGGLEAVRAARSAGFFWRAHGASLCAKLEQAVDAAALENALARVLGPGAPLL